MPLGRDTEATGNYRTGILKGAHLDVPPFRAVVVPLTWLWGSKSLRPHACHTAPLSLPLQASCKWPIVSSEAPA